MTERADRPLRVVAAIRQFTPAVGGAQHLLTRVLAALQQRGHDTAVVTFDSASVPDLRGHGSGLPARESLHGCTVHRVAPDGGLPGRSFTSIARHRWGGKLVHRTIGVDLPYWGDRPSLFGMSATLMRIPADVFISVGWFSRHVPVMHAAGRWRGIPVIGLPCFHLAQRSAYWPRHRALARSAAAVVTLSDPEAAHTRGLGARHVQTIAPVLPDEWAAHADGTAWRARHGIPAHVPLVAFVGRQVAKKGCAALVRAMHDVWQTHPDCHLLLAGRLRNRDDATHAALAALSSHERARVVEVNDFADEDTPSMLAACTMLAMPSSDEAFGIVYIEAWSCGRPVIAADIPSSRWLSANGEGALLVPPDDGPALTAAIRTLLDDPLLATRLGAYGQAMVASRFRPSQFASDWIGLVEQVIGLK